MPVIVERSIGSAVGRDYADINAWEAAAPVSLVANDQVWKGVVYNDSEMVVSGFNAHANIELAGSTSDATRYKWLTVAAGHSVYDNTANLTRYDATKGAGLRGTGDYGPPLLNINEPYAVAERLQFRLETHPTTAGWTATCCVRIRTDGIVARNLLCEVTSTDTNTRAAVYFQQCSATIPCSLLNTVIIGRGTGPYAGIRYGAAGAQIVRHVTIFRETGSAPTSSNVFHSEYGGDFGELRNVAVFGPWTGFDNGLSSTSGSGSNNVTSRSSWPHNSTTNTVLNASVTDAFVATAAGSEDLKPKAGGSLINAGTTTAGASPDPYGTTRHATTPTVGAIEAIVAAIMRRMLLMGVG